MDNMNQLQKRKYMELANVFVEERALLKYRFYDEDAENIRHTLHFKAVRKDEVTLDEMTHILVNEENVVVVADSKVTVFNPSGALKEYHQKCKRESLVETLKKSNQEERY